MEVKKKRWSIGQYPCLWFMNDSLSCNFKPQSKWNGWPLFFSSCFFLGVDMESKWDGRNKRGGVKCIINHQPLHCFLCIFLRGKGTNPKNIITTKLGDLKQLMKWRQKSFIVFVAKRKKNLNWGVWLNMWVQRAKTWAFWLPWWF